jgi:hypothetical protein
MHHAMALFLLLVILIVLLHVIMVIYELLLDIHLEDLTFNINMDHSHEHPDLNITFFI